MGTSRKFASGDRVIHTEWPSGRAGEVRTVARVSAMVLWDGEVEAKRVRLDAMRPETDEDVTDRTYRQQMDAWRGERPQTTIAIVERDARWGHGHEEIGVEIRPCRTPAEMRIAAREFEQLADWFERRPKERA